MTTEKTSAAPKAIAITKALAEVMRQDRGRLISILAAGLRDITLAEEALQEAAISALKHWGRVGLPTSPQGWLLQVARRKAIDRLRGGARDRARAEALSRLQGDEADEEEGAPIPDQRLSLIFTCCHPALEPKTRVALTLRTVCGLSMGQVAASFLDNETTMGQRLTRAKAKIAAAGIPFVVPGPEDWPDRLNAVLKVIYLIFTQGYRLGPQAGHDLCAEAIFLGRLTRELRPDDPEIAGCLALMLLTSARAPARRDDQGRMVPLALQDRALWDQALIAEGRAMLSGLPDGPFALQAGIAEAHLSPNGSDWPRIAGLYRRLSHIDANPVIRLNEAVALGEALGPEAAMSILSELSELDGYQPFHAARADMLRRMDLRDAARIDYQRAIDLADNEEDAAFLRSRLGQLEN